MRSSQRCSSAIPVAQEGQATTTVSPPARYCGTGKAILSARSGNGVAGGGTVGHRIMRRINAMLGLHIGIPPSSFINGTVITTLPPRHRRRNKVAR